MLKKSNGCVNIGSGFFFYLTTIIILFIGGQKVLRGQMSLGALVAIYSISLELILQSD
ncbi:TPA: hypothetical protein U1W61_001126 [Streptococcus suis]|nr:hypothetical protein [Streptococcus suis]